MRSLTKAAVAAVSMLAVVGLLVGCGTGDDAVAPNQANQFVSPGGKVVLQYPEADRKHIGNMSGTDLLNGNEISLTDPAYAGKVVVVNVWASWCAPCRKEFTELGEVYNKTRAKGVEFLGIDFRDSKSSAQDFVRDNKVEYRSIYDYGGASLAALGVPVGAVPTTVILDRQHRPATVFLRAISGNELHDAVMAVVNES